VYADTKGYWKSSYNIFDFTILALSFMQIIMSQLNVGENYLGVFRLLRGKFLTVYAFTLIVFLGYFFMTQQ
jgi:Ion transport protein.